MHLALPPLLVIHSLSVNSADVRTATTSPRCLFRRTQTCQCRYRVNARCIVHTSSNATICVHALVQCSIPRNAGSFIRMYAAQSSETSAVAAFNVSTRIPTLFSLTHYCAESCVYAVYTHTAHSLRKIGRLAKCAFRQRLKSCYEAELSPVDSSKTRTLNELN